MTTVLSQNCHVIVIAFNFTMNFPTAWRPSGRAGSWRWVQVCEASRLPGLANTMQAKIQHHVLTSLLPSSSWARKRGTESSLSTSLLLGTPWIRWCEEVNRLCWRCFCWGLSQNLVSFFVMVKVSQYYPTTLDITHLRFHFDNEIMLSTF